MGKNKIPEPLEGLPLIDCHCHFTWKSRGKRHQLTPEEHYEKFIAQNGKYMITSPIEWDTISEAMEYTEIYNRLGITLGWGPQTVTYTKKEKHEADFNKWLDYVLKNPQKYLAIGEIGLDFHHAKTAAERNAQIDIFCQIIQYTKHLNKPYVLHLRNPTNQDADPDNIAHIFNKPDAVNALIVSILEEEGIDFNRIVLHCFSGPTPEWGKKFAGMGCYVSIPSSAYGFNKWRRNMADVPLEQLLIETDGPFQHPTKMGELNYSWNVKYVIATIASTHNMDQMKVAKQILENAKNIYEIDID